MHIVVTYYLYCYFRPSASTTRWYSGWPYILYSNYTATSGRVPVLEGGTVGGRTYCIVTTYTVTQAKCQYYKVIQWVAVHIVLYLYCYSGRLPVLQGGTVGGCTYCTVPMQLLRPSASTKRSFSGCAYCTVPILLLQTECK